MVIVVVVVAAGKIRRIFGIGNNQADGLTAGSRAILLRSFVALAQRFVDADAHGNCIVDTSFRSLDSASPNSSVDGFSNDADALSNLDFVGVVKLEAEVVGRFEHQNDRRSQVELAKVFALADADASGRIFGEVEVLVVFLPRIPLVLVGGETRVQMGSDGSDSRSPDRRQREESVLPEAGVENALIIIEQTRNPTRDQRRDAEKISWKMSPESDGPIGWGMESMIVSRRQVNNQMVQFVSLGIIDAQPTLIFLVEIQNQGVRRLR